jgi:Arc/MetJ-type ribon-helix-helix transcriptional regulator
MALAVRYDRFRYDRGMTTKITISLPDEAVAAAKQAVREGRAESVSAYVNDALERTYGKQRPLALLVADIIAEHGEPSEEAVRWAKRAIGLAE